MQKTKSIALTLGVLAMSLVISYLVLAWTEPGTSPPGGNVPAPLNVSLNAQSKEGALVIGSNSGLTTGLIVQYGNVGIGTTAPGYKLDVASGGATTARFGTASTDKVVIGGGAGKLDAGTIDPIFEIDGKKYATYMADFAGGTRMETSGTLQLATNNLQPQAVIDFENLEEGSDLWLFWQASSKNIDDVVVILTPGFNGRVWYEKGENIIIIQGERAGEVSYRLSAPRVDHENWENLAEDQSLTGIKVSDY